MMKDVRQVWVIQRKSTGAFLHLDLYTVRSLKGAGRAPDFECAVETARMNLGEDYEIHTFFEEYDDSY